MTHTLKNPNVQSVAMELNKSLSNKMTLKLKLLKSFPQRFLQVTRRS